MILDTKHISLLHCQTVTAVVEISVKQSARATKILYKLDLGWVRPQAPEPSTSDRDPRGATVETPGGGPPTPSWTHSTLTVSLGAGGLSDPSF